MSIVTDHCSRQYLDRLHEPSCFALAMLMCCAFNEMQDWIRCNL